MFTFHLLFLAPMLALLFVAAVIDWRCRRIPNWLTFVLAVSGIAGTFIPGHLITVGQSLSGMGVGFAIPFVLFAMGALGGGDVKLLAGLGCWLGPMGAIEVFAVAAIVGMVIVLFQAAFHGRLPVLFRNSTVLTVNLINMGTVGADAVCETGKACQSVERPLPYAVPVLIATLIVIGIQL
jgi:prepilin peptidase CpaA